MSTRSLQVRSNWRCAEGESLNAWRCWQGRHRPPVRAAVVGRIKAPQRVQGVFNGASLVMAVSTTVAYRSNKRAQPLAGMILAAGRSRSNNLNELRLNPDGVHEATKNGVELAPELKLHMTVPPMTDNSKRLSQRDPKSGLGFFRHGRQVGDPDHPNKSADGDGVAHLICLSYLVPPNKWRAEQHLSCHRPWRTTEVSDNRGRRRHLGGSPAFPWTP